MRLPKVLAASVAFLLVGSTLAAAHAASVRDHGRAPAAQQASVVAAGIEDAAGFADSPAALAWTPTPSRQGAAPPSTTRRSGKTAARGSPKAAGPSPASPVPASPVPASPVPASPAGGLPVPSTAGLPPVAPLRSTREVDALVMLTSTLTRSQQARLAGLPGIADIDTVDTGAVTLDGATAVAFGVDPSTFRAFTPQASASSTRLWQYVAGGALVSSYEMASDRRLRLGSVLPVAPAGDPGGILRGWLGGFASIGLPGVDVLVDTGDAQRLCLTPDSGLVVSAPNLDGSRLRQELGRVVPGAAVELLRPDEMTGLLRGNTLDTMQRQRLITAALSRVGDPYAWGAAGPTSFDCSGLVQWSFAQAGIQMPRTADAQFLTGIHVPLPEAIPGDLLFWTYDPLDPGFVDHTAIYLGNGMMVVAPHTGLDVEVVPVPTSDFAGVVSVELQPA